MSLTTRADRSSAAVCQQLQAGPAAGCFDMCFQSFHDSDIAGMILQLEADVSSAGQQPQPGSSLAPLVPAASGTPPGRSCDMQSAAAGEYMGANANNWLPGACIMPDQSAQPTAAVSADAERSAGSAYTTTHEASYQLMSGTAFTAADAAAAAAAVAPWDIFSLDRRDSAGVAAGSSAVQCTSPGVVSSPRALSTGGFSAGLLSGSEDSSLQRPGTSAAAPAAAAAAGAATGGGSAGGAQRKRRAANSASQRRQRLKKQQETDTMKEQMAALAFKNAQLQEKADALRADHANLLARLADVTTKWQATVVENARLNQENGLAKAQLADMQQQLRLMQQDRDTLYMRLQQTQQQQQQQQQVDQAPIRQHQQQLCVMQHLHMPAMQQPHHISELRPHSSSSPSAAGLTHWQRW